MELERYLIGLALVGAGAAAVATAARALRLRAAPGWSGPPAWLAEAVIAIAIVLASAQLLGLAGLLRPVPLLVLWLLIAAGARLLPVPSPSPDGAPPKPAAGVTRLWLLVALIPLCAVAVQWLLISARALDGGMPGQDTLWYHMPTAARFAQDAAITALPYTSTDPLSSFPANAGSLLGPSGGTAFYPANASLLHAVGIVLFGNDTLSPVLNVIWLALALLAAWCIGRRHGVALHAAVAVALVFALPSMAASQPGEAANDAMALALLLAAVALLLESRAALPGVAIAGLAAGAALGTKFTMVAPTAVLTAAVVLIAPTGVRLRALATWTGAVLALAGFWYARNLVAVGNPLAPLDRIGPLSLPAPRLPVLDTFDQSVLSYLGDPTVWWEALLPALPEGLGPFWFAVLMAATVGVVLGALRGGRDARLLALLAAIAGVAYLATPQSAGGAEGDNPGLFLFNMRFAGSALAAGLLALVLTLGARQREPALAALAIVTAWTVAAGDADLFGGGPAPAALALGGVAAALIVFAPRRMRIPRASAAIALLLTLAVGTFFVQRHYTDARAAGRNATSPRVAQWASGVHDARIAIEGLVTLTQYTLYGRDLSNRVRYVGRRENHGTFAPVRSCGEWRAKLADGEYDYVVTSSVVGLRGPVPEAGWTATAPGARLLLRDGNATVFELRSPPPRTCG